MVEAFAAAHPGLPVRHVWHEDRGFEKNAILNRAIATSEADFLLSSSTATCWSGRTSSRGTCELARPDRWSSGSLIRLDAAATAAVTEALVTSGEVFDRDWLRAHGAIDRFGTWLKTRPLPEPVLAALDRLTPVQQAWGGSNSSAFRAALLTVNGFDEAMKYGGEDKELGVRLTNSGVRGQHTRYLASVVHLDHPPRLCRPGDASRPNKARVAEVRRSGRSWTPDGIVKESRRMKANVINLDRAPERWASIARLAASRGLAISRVAAVDGSDPAALAGAAAAPDAGCSPAEIACFESHRAGLANGSAAGTSRSA